MIQLTPRASTTRGMSLLDTHTTHASSSSPLRPRHSPCAPYTHRRSFTYTPPPLRFCVLISALARSFFVIFTISLAQLVRVFALHGEREGSTVRSRQGISFWKCCYAKERRRNALFRARWPLFRAELVEVTPVQISTGALGGARQGRFEPEPESRLRPLRPCAQAKAGYFR